MTRVGSYPIEELELGVVTYNVLKRMGVNTLEELARVTIFELGAAIERLVASGRHGFSAARAVAGVAAAQREVERLLELEDDVMPCGCCSGSCYCDGLEGFAS